MAGLRAFVAVILAVAILFVGLTGLSYQAQNVQDRAVANGTNESAEAFNMTTDIYEGLGEVFAPGVVWMGAAVLILLVLGFLLVAARSGR